MQFLQEASGREEASRIVQGKMTFTMYKHDTTN